MRNNKSFSINLFSHWAKSVDLFNLSMIIFLISLGILFVTTSSPSIAIKKDLTELYFIKKHGVFIILALTTLLLFSFFSLKGIINISFLGGGVSIFLMLITLIQNNVNNGAARWLEFLGFTIQPSEFFKSFLIIIFSYFLTIKEEIEYKHLKLHGNLIAFFLLIFTSILLVLQPNFSMLTIIFLVFFAQYFIAGINIKWVLITFANILFFFLVAYFSTSHVKSRISNYFNEERNHYQIEKSMEAYQAGGYFGKGPGEGTIKKNIPDAHTDFIFPVIAEEYGIITCFVIIFIIFTIFFRGLYRVSDCEDKFSIVACSGLLVMFILQSLINISVSVKLIPITGIPLPLISYGGSSLISTCIGLGMMLSITRKRFGGISYS
ncbi:MAG: hypothetical protein CMP24_07230 [Rickettsiales bacterium]|nr:hypothetical protein [Rickettsiales bacterium]